MPPGVALPYRAQYINGRQTGWQVNERWSENLANNIRLIVVLGGHLFGGTNPERFRIRAAGHTFPFWESASQNTRFSVLERRLFRDTRSGEFQESASRNSSFPVLEETTAQGHGPQDLTFHWAMGDFGWWQGLASLVEFEVGGWGVF